MKEIFGVGDTVFSAMIAVDVIVANVWMAFLLYGAGIHERLDSWLQADTSAITELKERSKHTGPRSFVFPISPMP